MSGLVELEIGPLAHGGHCVAHHDGRTGFVRHTLPGEVVLARITDSRSKLWRADAVQILQASPDRVQSAWPAAGPGGVGGGELAHVAPDAQRRWKAAVITDQLRRLAHLTPEPDVWDGTVMAVPGDSGGLGYRTRVDLVTDGSGRAGMHGFRSHRVIPLQDMPLAVPQIAELGLFSRRWPGNSRLEVAAPSDGEPVVLVDGQPQRGGRRHVVETVAASGREYRYRVAADGFWQVHRGAPQTLVEAVLEELLDLDLAGVTALDLYSGVGLFTLPLADRVGPDGTVWSIEGDTGAVRNARRNLHEHPQARLVTGDVGETLRGMTANPEVVVLDPPRAGARAAVVEQVARLAPRRVVYVACDPAALARDLGSFAQHGYALKRLRGFDMFPMTHHVECVAVLEQHRTGVIS